ncbi:reverse transcriptase domain-containing protein [Tanacetum coccineum]|uniref:Reverse transcriptase domain-containing protein n=1 Tax=Tanacetum coccineum TaxID=301880 RepID=A0ABQ5J1J4_9ASTR
MEKWAMSVTCHMFVYLLKDAARVWWNSLLKGVVTSYEDLKKSFWTHFKQQKKQTKTHLSINDIKRREGESVRAFITRYTDETTQVARLNEDQRIAGFVHGVKIKSLVKFISTELSESYDYCEFHQDYGHDTNACKELKKQIEEAVKSGKVAHLIKGIRKGRAKQTDTQLGEWTAPTVKAEPVVDRKEEPILMIRVINNPLKRKEPPRIMSVEEMIFPQYETGLRP